MNQSQFIRNTAVRGVLATAFILIAAEALFYTLPDIVPQVHIAVRYFVFTFGIFNTALLAWALSAAGAGEEDEKGKRALGGMVLHT